MTRALTCCAFAVLVAISATSARAQQRTREEIGEAESLFERGLALGEANRWGEAVELFRRSLEIVERPATLFNLGVALYHLGRMHEATQTLERFVESARGYPDLAEGVREAERHLTEMQPMFGHLRLALEPPDARVLVDGRAVEGTGSPRTITLDPGGHVLSVEAPGHRASRIEISLESGASEEREVRLEALREAPPTIVIERDTSGGGLSSDAWLAIGLGIGIAVLAAVGIGIGVAVAEGDSLYEGSAGYTFRMLITF